MRKYLLLAVVPLLLAGKACQPVSGVTCPSLKQYSPEFLKAVAAEYRAIEQSAPHLVQMIDDYGIERDAIRECIKRRAKK